MSVVYLPGQEHVSLTQQTGVIPVASQATSYNPYNRFTAQQVIDAIDFDVEMRPTWYKDAQGKVHQSQGYTIIKTDGGAELGFGMTEGYGLVTHKQVLEPALEALAGCDYVFRNLHTKNDGGRVMIEACAPDKPVTINGEKHVPRVIIKNSYDLTSGINVEMGYYRVVCSNGMIIPLFKGSTFKFSQKHSKNALWNLQDWQKAFNDTRWIEASVQAFNSLDRPVGFETAQEILRNVFGTTKEAAHKNKNVRMALKKARYGQGQAQDPNKQLTLWDLYNGITETLRDSIIEVAQKPEALYTRNDNVNTKLLKAVTLMLAA